MYQRKTFAYYFENGRLTIELNDAATEDTYGEVYDIIAALLPVGLRSILIDKKGQTWSIDRDNATAFGTKLGVLLKYFEARIAVVTDLNDYYDAAVGLHASQNGARILITDSLPDATLWLDRKIA